MLQGSTAFRINPESVFSPVSWMILFPKQDPQQHQEKQLAHQKQLPAQIRHRIHILSVKITEREVLRLQHLLFGKCFGRNAAGFS